MMKIARSRFITHRPICLSHRLSFKCNLKCKMCTAWRVKHKNELKLNEIFGMLDDARENDILFYIVTGGEPLLNKNFPKILKYAKETGLYTIFNTNGMLLKEKINKIADYASSITVSLDGLEIVHNRIRNCEKTFQRAIDGIKKAKELGVTIKINSTITRETVHEMESIAKLAKELGVLITLQPIIPYDASFRSLTLGKKDFETYVRNVFILKKMGYPITNSYKPLKFIHSNYSIYRKGRGCHYPEICIRVYPTGKVSSCKPLPINIKNTSFKEIFNSKIYKKLLINAQNCRKCHYKSFPWTMESNTLYDFDFTKMISNILNNLSFNREINFASL